MQGKARQKKEQDLKSPYLHAVSSICVSLKTRQSIFLLLHTVLHTYILLHLQCYK